MGPLRTPSEGCSSTQSGRPRAQSAPRSRPTQRARHRHCQPSPAAAQPAHAPPPWDPPRVCVCVALTLSRDAFGSRSPQGTARWTARTACLPHCFFPFLPAKRSLYGVSVLYILSVVSVHVCTCISMSMLSVRDSVCDRVAEMALLIYSQSAYNTTQSENTVPGMTRVSCIALLLQGICRRARQLHLATSLTPR